MSKRQQFADAKSELVFYGMRHIRAAANGNVRYTRYYVTVQKPDVVVEVHLVLPGDWYLEKKRISIDDEMDKLAKKFFPKAKAFMFYNRVSYKGIHAPPPKPVVKGKFIIEKSLSRKQK